MSNSQDREDARSLLGQSASEHDQLFAQLMDDDELVDRLLAVGRSIKATLLTMREERGISRVQAYGLLSGVLLAAIDDLMPDPERAP